MRGSLLWVYEGMTQYWGQVLSARSGMRTKQQAIDYLALTAAAYQYRVGREWRSLSDTTLDPILSARRPAPWRSWQRNEDYYSEGLLVWLDADTLIRERTRGRGSLDDVARGFFGIDDGAWTPATYTFDDVVAALNAALPYDWATFLQRTRRRRGHRAAARRHRAQRLSARVHRRAQPVPARFRGLQRQRRLHVLDRLVVRRERQCDRKCSGTAPRSIKR